MAALGRNWLWISFSSLLILVACNKHKIFDGPSSYSDSFENSTNYLDYLVNQDSAWSFTQLTVEGNKITIDTSMSSDGNQCIRFFALPTIDGKLSKCSMAKQDMAFWENETMVIEADYFLEGSDPLEWLFLLDLEEQTAIGAGPGMRLALVENALRFEFKFNQDDALQLNHSSPVQFPRNQWVNIKVEADLHHKKKGALRVWQDGVLILDKSNIKTLPKDVLYNQQGTKKMISSVEIGATANASSDTAIVRVDHFSVYKK